MHVSKWTFEGHHCAFLTSLPVHPYLYHSPACSELCFIVPSISHAPSSHRAFAHSLPGYKTFFLIIFPFPLLQPFYIVDFNFLVISAKHQLLTELFSKLLSTTNIIIETFPLEDLLHFADLCSSA